MTPRQSPDSKTIQLQSCGRSQVVPKKPIPIPESDCPWGADRRQVSELETNSETKNRSWNQRPIPTVPDRKIQWPIPYHNQRPTVPLKTIQKPIPNQRPIQRPNVPVKTIQILIPNPETDPKPRSRDRSHPETRHWSRPSPWGQFRYWYWNQIPIPTVPEWTILIPITNPETDPKPRSRNQVSSKSDCRPRETAKINQTCGRTKLHQVKVRSENNPKSRRCPHTTPNANDTRRSPK